MQKMSKKAKTAIDVWHERYKTESCRFAQTRKAKRKAWE